jgi:plastocyanin domain-containing protein
MKSTIIAVLIGVVFVGGAVVFSKKTPSSQPQTSNVVSNVTETAGTQIVTIAAKGGYSPRQTSVKADTPTTLRMQTNGTFDCSSTLNIPSLNYQKTLPATGLTEIEIPPQKAGTTVEGLCGMGMYKFEIAFK